MHVSAIVSTKRSRVCVMTLSMGGFSLLFHPKLSLCGPVCSPCGQQQQQHGPVFLKAEE